MKNQALVIRSRQTLTYLRSGISCIHGGTPIVLITPLVIRKVPQSQVRAIGVCAAPLNTLKISSAGVPVITLCGKSRPARRWAMGDGGRMEQAGCPLSRTCTLAVWSYLW